VWFQVQRVRPRVHGLHGAPRGVVMYLQLAKEIKLILIKCFGCRYSAYCREYTGYMALHVV
jgi:hypothetical protein